MRNTDQTIQWYKNNEVWPAQIGFDPDGMCLKICRVARGIGSMYPSALAAQNATPTKYRVHKVADIRRGMVVYYDDPRDGNPYGHIVTVVGRVKGVDRNDLSSLLVRTNSVQSNRIVVVRGDYFPRYWGDQFQFAATWLNGQELDLGTAPRPKPKPLKKRARRLRAAIKDLKKARRVHKKRGNDRVVRALTRDIKEIRQTIRKFS